MGRTSTRRISVAFMAGGSCAWTQGRTRTRCNLSGESRAGVPGSGARAGGGQVVLQNMSEGQGEAERRVWLLTQSEPPPLRPVCLGFHGACVREAFYIA